MMPFVLAEFANLEQILPLYVVLVGNHAQKHLARPEGYPAHQIFLSRSGKGLFKIEGRQDLILTPGTLLILPADQPHEYYPIGSDETWDLGFVAFNGSAALPLLNQMDELIMMARLAPNFDDLWSQIESLWHLISLNGEQAYWESSKRIYSMLVSVLEGQSAVKKPTKNVYPSGQSNAALQTAVKLIHDHYNERLLLTNVARAAGYSVQHFHRLFVENFGMTPQQYILQLRMRRSVQLFEEQPGITVEKVAEMTGMETSYFIRMFKRTYGKTPKQYSK
ncbi:AraC-like DNA-binding protein [Paenibacillus phyllosphaerae]|uniref:AraC-like DNA-binding protein n=1 Tax=Paenibacillus phyllosphaerae TaxID=274593 RepID=A0A7W5FLZ6_9BACL|nr:AraC family transcriptional regulator [Paenibacillus phyllosphaerae]MBB3109542.1 AraC-like DNA-binding protein [Paenibacillus phyllosphaerae]